MIDKDFGVINYTKNDTLYEEFIDATRCRIDEIEFSKRISNISTYNDPVNIYRINLTAYHFGGIGLSGWHIKLSFNKTFIKIDDDTRSENILITPENDNLFYEKYEKLVSLIEDRYNAPIEDITYGHIGYLSESEILYIQGRFGYSIEKEMINVLSAQIIKEIDDEIIKSLLNVGSKIYINSS